MSIPKNYSDPYEWAVECELRAEKAEARIKELKKLSSHGNGEVLLGWMDAHKKAMDKLEKAEARIKALEHYKYMISYVIEFAPPHIADEVKKELARYNNPSASAEASALDDTPKAH